MSRSSEKMLVGDGGDGRSERSEVNSSLRVYESEPEQVAFLSQTSATSAMPLTHHLICFAARDLQPNI